MKHSIHHRLAFVEAPEDLPQNLKPLPFHSCFDACPDGEEHLGVKAPRLLGVWYAEELFFVLDEGLSPATLTLIVLRCRGALRS